MISVEAKQYSERIAQTLFTLRARKKGRGWANRSEDATARLTQGELAELLGQAYDAAQRAELYAASEGTAELTEDDDTGSGMLSSLKCPDPKSCEAKGKCTEPHLQHRRTPKLAGMTLDSGDPR